MGDAEVGPKGEGDAAELYGRFRDLVERERRISMGVSVSIFAHDVGNRLNNLSLEAQMLERGLRKEEHSLLHRAQAILSELRKLNDRLADFRAMDRIRCRVQDSLDVVEVLREVIAADFAPDVRGDVTIDEDVSEEIPRVLADRDDVRQILFHLFRNAIDALPEGGIVTVHVGRDRDTVVLSIEDSGPGVDEGIDLFQPLQSTNGGRSGLELCVVRYLVKANDGTVHYDSSRDTGTTFTVSLPIAQAAGQP